MKSSGFVLIYCDDAKPWENYLTNKKVINDIKSKSIPFIFAIHRWDGTFGLPGGSIEVDEDIEESIRRELLEEINFKYDGQLTLSDSYFYTEINKIYLFSIKVSYEEIKKIMKNAQEAEHFGSEILGHILIPIINYDDKKGFNQSISHNYAGLLKSDIIKFVKEKNLINI